MKIAAVDFETTSLRALMGRILCGSILPIANVDPRNLKTKPKPYCLRGDRAPFKNMDDTTDDVALCEALRDEIHQYNMIVTWNGKLFDIPFLNARLAKAGKPLCQPQMHLDLMYFAGGVSLRVGSRKLVNVQKFLGLEESKTDISWEQWQRAASLNHAAMNEVVYHCNQDVEVLAQAYHRMIGVVRNIHR